MFWLTGPILTTFIVADWSPVVTVPPWLPPELVETPVVLLMLPLLCEGVDIGLGTTGAGIIMDAGEGAGVLRSRSDRLSAIAGAAASKSAREARASDVRIV